MSSNLIFVVLAIIAFALFVSKRAQLFAIALVAIFLVAASASAIVKRKACTAGETCTLMPTWAGTCIPATGAVIVADGKYHLVSGDTRGEAYCGDVRIWRSDDDPAH